MLAGGCTGRAVLWVVFVVVPAMVVLTEAKQ